MKRYNNVFKKLLSNNEGAFIPFVVIGDPSIEYTKNIIDIIINSGADALELGFPFSDPVADGPTIQSAMMRALKSGVDQNFCFSCIKEIRNKYPQIPIGILVYANLVFCNGIEEFYKKCQESGVDSVLIPDLPIEESSNFCKVANYYNIDEIFICPPNATDNFLKKISKLGRGYIYLVSRLGITGVEDNQLLFLKSLINKLKKYNSVPIIQGFGISNTDQIKTIIQSGATGVISGSVIIKIIEENQSNLTLLCKKLNSIVRLLKNATINTII
ncbi:tryptophan synthase subunit alpha [Candidatus Tachikawaea gelatinosa]|uniref:Tryptophan synthase alpha chain n=1 Tax=Candidatus Tachikawaea gelatinosa TaxID=1410383 RepID=A0A090BWK6_9ENTR|nr:tryptophan synthase subunit alpha [Candidatus Tachikawaea gelatinosa]BAP58771.1 tryptophan synthase alpha chain [Candidatus Tachikawaea gelatinosa]